MDLDHLLSFPQLLVEAFNLAFQALDLMLARTGGVPLASTLAVTEFLEGATFVELAPGRKMRGIEAFAAQEGTDFSWLRAAPGLLDDA